MPTDESPKTPDEPPREPQAGGAAADGSFADRLAQIAPMTKRMRKRVASITQSLLGRRAISRGFVTSDQILDALRLQYRARFVLQRSLRLGEVLWMQGAVTSEQLDELLDDKQETYAKTERKLGKFAFGDLARLLNFCTSEQVLEALDTQLSSATEGEPPLIGQILFDRGYITREQLDAVLEAPIDFDTTSSSIDGIKTDSGGIPKPA